MRCSYHAKYLTNARHTENEESAQPGAPRGGLPPGAAQRALRGRGRGMPRRG